MLTKIDRPLKKRDRWWAESSAVKLPRDPRLGPLRNRKQSGGDGTDLPSPQPKTEQDSAEKPNSAGAAVLRIRVVLADDHVVLRKGIGGLLARQPDIEIVGEAGDGDEAIELVRKLRPDVVVMDITMPRVNGIEATAQIAQQMPGIRVIGLSMHEEEDMARAMRDAGAVAFLTKGGPAHALISAIRTHGRRQS